MYHLCLCRRPQHSRRSHQTQPACVRAEHYRRLRPVVPPGPCPRPVRAEAAHHLRRLQGPCRADGRGTYQCAGTKQRVLQICTNNTETNQVFKTQGERVFFLKKGEREMELGPSHMIVFGSTTTTGSGWISAVSGTQASSQRTPSQEEEPQVGALFLTTSTFRNLPMFCPLS